MYKDDFYTQSIEETLKNLNTGKDGLEESEVIRRRELFGENTLTEKKISKLKLFFDQFNNIFAYILIVAALISFFTGKIVDSFVIVGIISLNGVLSFWQELKAEISIRALKKLTETKNTVIRGGKLKKISASELVPGDFITLREGDLTTADIRLCDSSGLMIDESMITGESGPVIKDHEIVLPPKSLIYELKNMLLSGTVVTRGNGSGVVVKTGMHTYLAEIKKLAEKPSPVTPLTRALNSFIKKYAGLLLTIFGILGFWGYIQGRSLLELVYILIASLVSVIPEGLPILVTIIISVGALRLSRKKALIRHLPSTEVLGSATIIASDKTGTITEGKLVVKKAVSEDEETLKFIAALCNDANGEIGDPLDISLAKWVENYEEIRKKHHVDWSYPFDTKLRLMAVAAESKILVKGAYESLKEMANQEDDWENSVNELIKDGLRVLAFGIGDWNGDKDPKHWKIKIVGLIGFLDPPKKDVKEAVLSAKAAGVRVMMLTGDHPLTAKEIAREVDIYKEDEEVLLGKEVEGLSDQELIKKLGRTSVVARILPEHKSRIVTTLQNNKEIVAVTGDGVNDVPALKAADLGIAMGGGSEAAKDVSKMVITDNNLSVIVDAIKGGRIIVSNIRKAIYYLVSTGLQEVTILLLAILAGVPMPLTAIQILWINLVTDGVTDKTFALTKDEGDVMLRKPKSPEKQFFDLKQIINIASFGVIMGFLCFMLFLYLLPKVPLKTASTIVFTCVVIAQWANVIQAQKEIEPFFKNIRKSFTINPFVFLGVGLGVVLQLSVIYFWGNIFHTEPLTLSQWIYPIMTFLAAFALVEIRKVLYYAHKN